MKIELDSGNEILPVFLVALAAVPDSKTCLPSFNCQMSTQMYGSMDKFPARCQSCCTLPVRFAFLLLVAVIGCIIVAVLMSVSDIRSSISYKKTDCTIREHILQRNAANETRGALLVRHSLIHSSPPSSSNQTPTPLNSSLYKFPPLLLTFGLLLLGHLYTQIQ